MKTEKVWASSVWIIKKSVLCFAYKCEKIFNLFFVFSYISAHFSYSLTLFNDEHSFYYGTKKYIRTMTTTTLINPSSSQLNSKLDFNTLSGVLKRVYFLFFFFILKKMLLSFFFFFHTNDVKCARSCQLCHL